MISNNLNWNKLFMVAFNTVAKPLMPENIQKMITFHTDFQSLHEFVNKGGVISDDIFNVVSSSKKWTK